MMGRFDLFHQITEIYYGLNAFQIKFVLLIILILKKVF